jgi:hypothetical protein
MKPLGEKTFVEQALKNNKGITWLDDCRIPVVDQEKYEYNLNGRKRLKTDFRPIHDGGFKNPKDIPVIFNKGRFPANLLISDDILNDGTISKSKSGGIRKASPNSYFGKYPQEKDSVKQEIHDEGSFSRFYDLDLWFKDKIKELPLEVQKTFPFLIVAKASKSEKNKGTESFQKSRKLLKPNYRCKKCGRRSFSGSPCTCKDPEWEIVQTHKKGGNIHPTTKPITLMSYLITLGSMEDNIVLDPYIGSGTTAIACKLLRRNYIGCDINKDYLKIAVARLKSVKRSFDLSKLIKKRNNND